ncbi:zinc ribbon domain-containing protein [Actinacidiphila sp. bgisy145]|uniref:zinc ribbon domain-containing protein n=1 Tax=Actinacidiphila sp. bgisy145 TaxID=3413792 RepID=UPI003EBF6B8E
MTSTSTWATHCDACGAPLPTMAPTAGAAPAASASTAASGGPSTWNGSTPGPAGPAPRWGGGHDITRYLCAAAYLDRAYAETLIGQVAAEPHLGVAPAPACDVPVVLRHAYLANARRHQRDLLLTALLALTLAGLLGILPPWTTPLALLGAWSTALTFEFSTRYGSHLQSLRPNRFHPAAAPEPPNPGSTARLRQIDAYARGNITAYSGYSPYTGYGTRLESWSLMFDITAPAAAGSAPQDVDVVELYTHVAQRLRTLALPALEIEERLFVAGDHLIGDPRFLADPLGRPLTTIGQDAMDALKRHPEENARPYLAAHSTAWDGELVTSLFLRFVRSRSNLSVEGFQTVLLPLAERYRVIDGLLPSPSPGDVVEVLTQSLVSTPFLILLAPVRAVRGFSPDRWISWRTRRQNKRITALNRFDYGARVGVREAAAVPRHQRHFQKADATMALKAMEKRALDALVEFAEARGIDVSELVQRQEVIVNNGIIATQGASVSSNSVASGPKSRISLRPLNRIPLVNTN